MRAEQVLPKDDILTAYLNVSPFGRNYRGENIAGIETAAQGVFGVSAKDLTLAEACYLVGMPQNPYTYTPYTATGQLKSQEDLAYGLARQQYVLERMYIEGYLSDAEYQQAKQEDITHAFKAPAGEAQATANQDQDIDPYLYQALEQETLSVLARQQAEQEQLDWHTLDTNTRTNFYQRAKDQLANGGLTVESSIDPKLYALLNQQMNTSIASLGSTYTEEIKNEQTQTTQTVAEPVQNGAVLMDNATGEILGFIAGRDFNQNQVDHAFVSRRQPGSTLKPILTYGPALEEGIAGPSTILPDTAIHWQMPDGSYYEPKNFGATVSNQLVSYRYALANSLNNPTIYLYRELLGRGVNIQQYAERMGLQAAIDPGEYKNMALPIGGLATGPTVAEVAGAFAVFANGGTYHQPHLIRKITTASGTVLYQAPSHAPRVFSEDTAYVVGDVLREVWKSGTFAPVKKQLTIDTDLYLKTGTSEDFNDLWVAGSTPTITLVSWVGYDNVKTKHTFDDGNESATYGEPGLRHDRYWAGLMNALNDYDPTLVSQQQQFYQPQGVSKQKIVKETGTRPGTFATPYGTITVSEASATTQELFTQAFPPPAATFNFAIQATDEQKWQQLQKVIKTTAHSQGGARTHTSAASASH